MCKVSEMFSDGMIVLHGCSWVKTTVFSLKNLYHTVPTKSTNNGSDPKMTKIGTTANNFPARLQIHIKKLRCNSSLVTAHPGAATACRQDSVPHQAEFLIAVNGTPDVLTSVVCRTLKANIWAGWKKNEIKYNCCKIQTTQRLKKTHVETRVSWA